MAIVRQLLFDCTKEFDPSIVEIECFQKNLCGKDVHCEFTCWLSEMSCLSIVGHMIQLSSRDYSGGSGYISKA